MQNLQMKTLVFSKVYSIYRNYYFRAKPFPSKVVFHDLQYRTMVEISEMNFKLEGITRAAKTDILNVMSNFILDYTL
jgi:hypothetical protein